MCSGVLVTHLIGEKIYDGIFGKDVLSDWLRVVQRNTKLFMTEDCSSSSSSANAWLAVVSLCSSAEIKPAWPQTLSWTRTSATGWVWTAATPSPTAAAALMWRLPSVSPSASSTWTASGSRTWRATSARSESPRRFRCGCGEVIWRF